MIGKLQPGDVVAVRSTSRNFWQRLFARLIRFGAALEDKANLVNHIVIVHHRDAAGVLWGIEGRPGGVGWVDLAEYDNKYLASNTAEPKSANQREDICGYAMGLLGVAYDWLAIGVDATTAAHLTELWGDREWGDRPPAHVVCSSLADYVYDRVGLAHPGNGRYTTPADWYELFLTNGWA